MSALTEKVPPLLAVIACGWLLFWLVQPVTEGSSDFPQFYAPAKLIASGRGAETYQSDRVGELVRQNFTGTGARIFCTFLPPPSLVWLLPFGVIPAQTGAIVWRILQAVSLIASTLLLRDVFALNNKACFWLLAALCLSGPAWAAVRIDQVSLFLLCALATAVWALKKNRSWAVAVALSFLMFKPQVGLPFLAYLAGARRYKELLLTAGVLASITLLSCGLIGVDAVGDYLRYGASAVVDKSALMQSELGPNLRGQLLRLLPTGKTLIGIVSGVVNLAALIFIFVSGRRFASSRAWLEAGLMIAVPLGLVTCFHVHSYDLTLLAPTVVTIMAGPLAQAIAPVAMLAGMLFATVFMVPLYIIIHWYYLLRDHGLVNPQFVVLLGFAISSAYLAYRYPDKLTAAETVQE